MLATSLRPCSGGGGYEGPVRRDASGAGPPVRPPAAEALEAGGHDVTVAAREKDVTTDLLDAADVPYAVVSHAGAGPLSRIGELLEREIGLVRLARRIDPDVVVSQVDPAAVHAARLVGARAVVFDDSEHERLVAGLTHRFADVVCTPSGFDREVPNQRRYDGFHELAYLHPNRFTPDPAALQRHGVDPESSSYAVVRFVAWDAHHDLGRRGFSPAGKQQLVERLDEHGTVYVTAEGEPRRRWADPRSRSRRYTTCWRSRTVTWATRRRWRPRPRCSERPRCGRARSLATTT